MPFIKVFSDPRPAQRWSHFGNFYPKSRASSEPFKWWLLWAFDSGSLRSNHRGLVCLLVRNFLSLCNFLWVINFVESLNFQFYFSYRDDSDLCMKFQAKWEYIASQLKGRINLAKVNVMADGISTGSRFGVEQVPTFLLYDVLKEFYVDWTTYVMIIFFLKFPSRQNLQLWSSQLWKQSFSRFCTDRKSVV